MGVTLRDAAPKDEDFILALNAASTPAVAVMDRNDYRKIAGWACRVLVAQIDDELCGFLILIRPGSDYPSDNYGWFEERFDNHLYIDRIAVSEFAKGQGAGRAFYEEAARVAGMLGEERLTCEVNEAPPNPESMAFHARLGFHRLTSRTSGSGKVVVMLEKPL